MNVWQQLLASGVLTAVVGGLIAWAVQRSAAHSQIEVAETAAAAALKGKQDEIAAGAWERAEKVYKGGLDSAERQIDALKGRIDDQDRHIEGQDHELVGCRQRISVLEADLAEERRQRRNVERELRVAKQALALVHRDEPGDQPDID